MKTNKLTKKITFLFTMFMVIAIFPGCDADKVVENKGVKSQDSLIIAGNDGVILDNTKDDENIEENSDVGSNDIIVVSQKGWFIKLNVQSDTLQDSGTVLGLLEGASDEKDKYDSEALASSGLYTTIYNEGLGSTKHYRSDYRAYAPVGEKSATWIVEVHSGDKNANVTLSWDGITYVTKNAKGGFDEELKKQSLDLENMRLLDIEDATVVSVLDNEMRISFSMNGNSERTFKWILLQDGESEPEAKAFEKL